MVKILKIAKKNNETWRLGVTFNVEFKNEAKVSENVNFDPDSGK